MPPPFHFHPQTTLSAKDENEIPRLVAGLAMSPYSGVCWASRITCRRIVENIWLNLDSLTAHPQPSPLLRFKCALVPQAGEGAS